MLSEKPSRQICQICERRRLITNFTAWGQTQQICKDCERALMKMAEDDLAETPDTDLPEKPPTETAKKAIPYAELDPNIVSLVRALNRYPGVRTMGSCGGHEVITNPSQWEAGTWYVKFSLPANRFGWLLLEHLSWAINHDCRRAGRQAMLLPTSMPPFLNTPGECLAFVIEGFGGEDPDELAQFLVSTQKYLTEERN
jgi:hypothetical protein